LTSASGSVTSSIGLASERSAVGAARTQMRQEGLQLKLEARGMETQRMLLAADEKTQKNKARLAERKAAQEAEAVERTRAAQDKAQRQGLTSTRIH